MESPSITVAATALSSRPRPPTPGPPGTTISGLNTCKVYDLYLASSQNPNVKCSWQLGTAAAATGTAQFLTNTTAVRLAQTWAPLDNYMVFSGVAPDLNGKIYVWGRG